MDEFKRFVSIKWPEHTHGVLSLEIQLAMKAWMEAGTRTQKDIILRDAENKPNWHTSKKPIKIPGSESEAVPETVPNPPPTANAIVINNNGNSSNEQSEDVFEWAKRLGVTVGPRNIQEAKKILSDSEYKNQIKKVWITRLQAKEKRRVVKDLENIRTSRSNENKEMVKHIVAFVNSPGRHNIIDGHEVNIYESDGLLSDDNLKHAIRVLINKTDKRTIQARIDKLEADEEIEKVEVDNTIHGKPASEKQMFAGWRIKNMESLYT
jgi:hypothetical protein